MRTILRRFLRLTDFLFAGQPYLKGIANLHRLDKAQVFHTVVGNHRPDARINKQPGGGRNHKVAVRDPLAKQRFGRADLVHMGIEVVATQAGKIDDIGLGHGTPRRQQAFAQAQLLEIFAERMYRLFNHRRAAYPLTADCRQHGRTALNGRALHIVFYRA